VTDAQLISAHLAGDPAAFRALVRRHLDMVHAAATRQAPDSADDITQAVFLLLHQKARSLRHRPNLAGWLFTTTRLCASHARRAAHRRRIHEREAAMHNQTVSSDPASAEPTDHATLLPLLDTALASLPRQDRDLLIQRHLQNRPLEDLASELNISLPATTKRAQRALERLRQWFAHHGQIVPTPTLTATLLSQSAHRVPTAFLTSSGTSATATAIAKSVRPLLLSGTLKAVAAAAALLFVSSVALWATARAMLPSTPTSAVSPAAHQTTAAPLAINKEADLDEAKITGDMRIAQFDFVIESAAVQDLLKNCTPIAATTQPATDNNPQPNPQYMAYRAPTSSLFDDLRQLRDANLIIPPMPNYSLGNVHFANPKDADPPLFFSVSYGLPRNNAWYNTFVTRVQQRWLRQAGTRCSGRKTSAKFGGGAARCSASTSRSAHFACQHAQPVALL
jgi:RNA polymerase sigma factor (sigma-70 family)